MADGVIAFAIQGLFVGFGSAIGSYLAQKGVLKNIENSIKKLEDELKKRNITIEKKIR